MRLVTRLVLALGFVAAFSTAGLGLVERERWRADRTARFEEDVRGACDRVAAEVKRQAETDRKLVAGACQTGELVDRVLVAMEAGELEGRRLALAALVPSAREAFDLDELLLATGSGDVLGADPRRLLALTSADVRRLVRAPTTGFAARTTREPALEVRCRRQSSGDKAVALVGARHLAPLLERLGRTANVHASTTAPAPREDLAVAQCAVEDGAGASLPLYVSASTATLQGDLRRIDEGILFGGLVAVASALLVAVLVARGLSRPLAELAAEARRVAAGDARPVRPRGAAEVRDLALAFDRMLADLEATRQRLAAATRVAAWREVARRVAHEVKNPLAPIRAAVETLRRLRAREDPAFDDYFDEASKTVLDEVHRIANIVTEFTRYARLPPPRPEPVDLGDLLEHTAQLHRSTASDVTITFDAPPAPVVVKADKDQVVQVVTNLVQNALDALAGRRGTVRLSVARTSDGARVVVEDDGPGIAPDLLPRLFEPYATSKATGSGLGLAISQRIAVDHGGALTYRPSRSGGASFELSLPAEGPKEPAGDAGESSFPPAAAPRGARASIEAASRLSGGDEP